MKKPHIHIDPRASLSQRRLLSALADKGVPANAEIIYDGRRNTIYRLVLEDGTVVSVKAFRVPPFPNPYVYGLFRRSKARRSYENAVKLLSLGFGTPSPIGYVETWRGIGFHRSYYVCRHLDGVSTLRELPEGDDADTLLQGVAHQMALLRHKGVAMHDFSPGNILYFPDGRGGYCFSYVDVNRITFEDGGDDATMAMFDRISIDPVVTRRLAGFFADETGSDRGDIIERAAARLERYIRRHTRKRKLQRLIGIKRHS